MNKHVENICKSQELTLRYIIPNQNTIDSLSRVHIEETVDSSLLYKSGSIESFDIGFFYLKNQMGFNIDRNISSKDIGELIFLCNRKKISKSVAKNINTQKFISLIREFRYSLYLCLDLNNIDLIYDILISNEFRSTDIREVARLLKGLNVEFKDEREKRNFIQNIKYLSETPLILQKKENKVLSNPYFLKKQTYHVFTEFMKYIGTSKCTRDVFEISNILEQLYSNEYLGPHIDDERFVNLFIKSGMMNQEASKDWEIIASKRLLKSLQDFVELHNCKDTLIAELSKLVVDYDEVLNYSEMNSFLNSFNSEWFEVALLTMFDFDVDKLRNTLNMFKDSTEVVSFKVFINASKGIDVYNQKLLESEKKNFMEIISSKSLNSSENFLKSQTELNEFFKVLLDCKDKLRYKLLVIAKKSLENSDNQISFQTVANLYFEFKEIINFNVFNEPQLSLLFSCENPKKSFNVVVKSFKQFGLKMNFEEFKYYATIKEYQFDEEFFPIVKEMNPRLRVVKSKEWFLLKSIIKEYFGNIFKNSDIFKIMQIFMTDLNRMTLNDFIHKQKNMRMTSDEYKILVLEKMFTTVIDYNFEDFNSVLSNLTFYVVSNKDKEKELNLLNELNYLKLNLGDSGLITLINKELSKYLSVDAEFIKENLQKCIKFTLSKDFLICKKYLGNPHADTNSKNNLKLIAKAIILEKYNELKFDYQDIQKEIGCSVSQSAFDAWKQTDSIEYHGGIRIEDASDFNTIMTIGKYPTSTCMNYERGIYSECLISNFDSCKKILKIYKNGNYIARAIIRLSAVVTENQTTLTFKDYSNENEIETGKQPEKQLAVFIEKLYTVSNEPIMEMVIDFMMRKCQKLGNVYLCSGMNLSAPSLKFIAPDSKWKYLLINRSKNGSQYLDSFYGKSSTVDQLTYVKLRNPIYSPVNYF